MGNLQLAGAVLHHLAHEGAVFGADVLVAEVLELREAHDLGVPGGPVVHLAEVHIRDDVVDGGQAHAAAAGDRDRLVAGREDTAIVPPFDEFEHRVAGVLDHAGLEHAGVGAGAGTCAGAGLCFVRPARGIQAALVAQLPGGLQHGRAARLDLAHGRLDVRNLQRDHFDAVAVQRAVPRDVAVGREGAGQHKSDVALLEDVAGPIAAAGFQAHSGDRPEAERLVIEMRRLARVPDIELDVVVAAQREEIVLLRLSRGERLGRVFWLGVHGHDRRPSVFLG